MSADTPNTTPADAPAPPTPEAILTELAKQIRGQHARLQKSQRASLSFARAAGESLKKAKGIVKEEGGAWLRWLKKNCKLSSRQAQKYMQLAEGCAELAAQGHNVADLTINEAVKLLASLRDKQAAGDKVKATPAERMEPQPLSVPSPSDLRLKEQETHRLVASQQIRFAEDTPEGQFVQKKVQGLVAAVRRQAAKLSLARGAESVQAVHLAIALIERLSLELHAEVVIEVQQPADKKEALPTPETTLATTPPAAPVDVPAPRPVEEPATVMTTPASPVEVSPATQPGKRTTNGPHKRNGSPVPVS